MDGFFLACVFFFFQAEDGIRDSSVTGVQTCALPSMLDSADQSDEERQRSREEHIERQLAQMRGQEMTVRVIEVDRQRNHLVLSQQLHTDEEREAMLRRREQLFRELRPGEVRRGAVKSFTRLGVRVDWEDVEVC